MNMRARYPDGRTRLREATRNSHERLHLQKALAALAGGTIDLPGYRALLARLHGFHAPLEARVAASAWAGRVDGAVLAPRAGRLRQDLVELGADDSELARLPVAAASDLPDLDGFGRSVGCLYVRAGSTLGARLLSKALDPLLGAGNPLGRGFLAGGDGADLQWRAAAPRWTPRRSRGFGTTCALARRRLFPRWSAG